MKKSNGNNIIRPLLLLLALAIFMSFCMNMTGESLARTDIFFLVITIGILCLVFRKNLPRDGVVITMLGGVFVKACYILYTPVWERQHDVISFGAGEGHAAYIEYILNYKSLPDFDPRLIWGFFQPPLHHFIAAVWMWINIRLKITERQLQENVQVLTLCYMCILMLAVYYICKELYMKNRGILITMLIVSFHPIFILLSGSINNDALSIMFMAVTLYIAVMWYKKPGFISIILMALSIGLGMATKLSAGMIAPAVGIMMLYKLWMEKDKWIKLILQYVAFAVVVFPIGLWWTIRNMIRFNMPVNYIPEVGEQLTHSDFFSRVFDIRMTSVYPELISNGSSYDEYNVWLAMIKTSLFGESNFGQVSGLITPFAWVLFISFIVIILLELVAFVRVIFAKETSLKMEYRILLGVSAVTILVAYLSFALSYNNFSAQDFRYGALMIAIMAIMLGLYDDRLDCVEATEKSEGKLAKIKLLRKIIFVVSIVFAVSSAAVYILVGVL